MVQKDAFARENMLDSKPDDSIVRRRHLRAGRRADVFSVMGIAGLAVHDADAAEDPGSFPAHRLNKTVLPQFALGIGRESLLYLLLLSLPSRQALFIEIDLVLGKFQVLDTKFLLHHLDGVRDGPAVSCVSDLNGQVVRSRRIL